jgi:hypothetical protein
MSSRGEMKMSLSEMICEALFGILQKKRPIQRENKVARTFSCRRCLSSLGSRYVLLLSTGVEKGFMIFLMATEVPESWSLAELRESAQVTYTGTQRGRKRAVRSRGTTAVHRLFWGLQKGLYSPDQTKGAHSDGL